MPRARHRRWAAWGWTDRERSASKLLGAPPWLDDLVGAFGLPSPLMSATAESATTYFCFLPLRPSREVSLGPEVMDAARLTEPQAEHMVRVVATFLIDKRPALKGRCPRGRVARLPLPLPLPLPLLVVLLGWHPTVSQHTSDTARGTH